MRSELRLRDNQPCTSPTHDAFNGPHDERTGDLKAAVIKESHNHPLGECESEDRDISRSYQATLHSRWSRLTFRWTRLAVPSNSSL